jgi:hypothetical protein
MLFYIFLIVYYSAVYMLALQGRFLPVATPEQVLTTPPRVLGNAATGGPIGSSRIHSNKRVAYDECSSSADEHSNNYNDLVSQPSLKTTGDTVRVRTKAVSNSALRMQVCHLTDKLAARQIYIDQANEQHDSATNIIVSLKRDGVDLKANTGVSDEL